MLANITAKCNSISQVKMTVGTGTSARDKLFRFTGPPSEVVVSLGSPSGGLRMILLGNSVVLLSSKFGNSHGYDVF